MLNETIRLKESLNEARNDAEKHTQPTDNQNSKEEEEIQIIKETLGEKQKCDECDFETCVPKYIKGHKVVKHDNGQYQCQRGNGCKAAFKTLRDLDEHIKSVHGQSNAKPSTFQCDKCDQTFDARAKLRVHNEKKHLSKQSSYQCENCDKVFPTQGQKNVHMNECTAGFETVKTSLCRYFMNGYCLKGSSFTFSHQRSLQLLPSWCRNTKTKVKRANRI